MSAISVIMSDPDLKVVETPDCLSLCSGITPDHWANGNTWLSSPDEVGRVCAACGDAAVLQIARVGGEVTQIRAWRAVFTCREIYYTKTPDGTFLFADHLRNILAELPMARRQVGDHALVDFLLFRSAPGRTAYCSGVERVGPGELLTIDLRTRTIARSRFDAISGTVEKASRGNYIERIDRAFEEVLAPWRGSEGVVNLFSGGVDSSIVQSYLGPDVPAVTGVAWNLSTFEKDYAANAARIMGLDHRTFDVQEHEFLPLLESAIEISGQPPLFDQVVIFYKAFQQTGRVFFSGCAADSMFGLDAMKGGTARAARLLARLPGGRLASMVLPDGGPDGGKGRLARVQALRAQLTRSPEDALGYAGRLGALTDMPMMEQVFGPGHIAERLGHRLEVALPAVKFASPPGDKTGRQVEMAHWAIVLTDDGHKQLRTLAQGLGKVFASPFMTRTLANSSLRVPLFRRHVRGRQSKYLLKDLLRQRVPEYPVNQKKGASLFGVENFFKQGPLENLWEKYPLPDCFVGRDKTRFIENPGLLSWNVAAFAIWRDRVLRNQNLTLTPGVRRFNGLEGLGKTG